MKRYILFAFILAASLHVVRLSAQSLEQFELEFALVATDEDVVIGNGLDLELRYNLREKPIDFAVRWSVARVSAPSVAEQNRRFRKLDEFPVGTVYAHGISYLKVFADYNILQKKLVSPYIGLGAGMGDYQTYTMGDYPNYCLCPIFTARAGINIAHHARVWLDYSIIPQKTAFRGGFVSYSANVQKLIDDITDILTW